VRDILGREHQPHARHAAHAVEIVQRKPRVRVRRAQYGSVQSARRHHVGDVAAGAGQEGRILLAFERLTESEFHIGNQFCMLSEAPM
jgi:hypothetical protein